MPHLASPPGYSSATNSQLTTSSLYRYNTLSNDAFFSKGFSQWGEAFLSLWGQLDICPLLHQFHVTSIPQLELSCLTSLKAWGMWRSSIVTWPSHWSQLRRGQQGTGCMVSLQYGWTPIKPGFPLWRKQLSNWLPWSPMGLIGLMPWCSSMVTPAMCHFLGRGAWASCQKEAPAVLPAEGSAN